MSAFLHITETRSGPRPLTWTVICRCGWTGPVVHERTVARADGDRHLAEANAR